MLDVTIIFGQTNLIISFCFGVETKVIIIVEQDEQFISTEKTK